MEKFTANDRCDKCGAQAYVRTVVTGDMILQWCGHHWNEVRPKIEPALVEPPIEELKALVES